MFLFVTGGSASGKSGYAGELAERIAARSPGMSDGQILYIATLADQSPESAERIERHRHLRKNGSYTVAECFSMKDLNGIVDNWNIKSNLTENSVDSFLYNTILFDSLDGFTSNVMFGAGEAVSEAETVWNYMKKEMFPDNALPEQFSGSRHFNTVELAVRHADPEMMAGDTFFALKKLHAVTENLILVSDAMYSDGILYDDATRRYMQYTAAVERRAAAEADCVVEVVCGIPLLLKGENHEFLKISHHNDVSIYPDSHACDRMG